MNQIDIGEHANEHWYFIGGKEFSFLFENIIKIKYKI